ncbi:MAG: adenylate/guanylate cyclase domain-containing protein [Chloroflexota bacterium]
MTSPSEWPEGTVTFLFTDIEGSTQLWEQYPQHMREALAHHDALLQQVIHENNGRLVKTTGDGALAVFTTAHDALAAGLAIQHAFQDKPVVADRPALHVRIGIHTGEAQLRGGDYFGSAVNRAARIMALANGDQVLLSGVTTVLVTDVLPPGVTLCDLGEHQLRGLSRPEQVFQLNASGLRQEFPPLRAAPHLVGNLTQPLTSFVGRERELESVEKLLGESRLVTLTGPGGTGKTRLSLEIGRIVQDQYKHGVWFVELAPIGDPDLVPAAVGELWGLHDGLMGPVEQQVMNYVRSKELLLILDNCEHLVSACAQLATDLLPVAPELTILASSREGLGVAGETTYHLPTLSVPERSVTDVDALGRYEAVRLFVQRAQAARSGFQLTDHNATAVGQIVRRLDGIPLAIELAAARVKLMPPEQLASRLDDRFRLLTGGSRTALPRQQTLRALIDWSYDLLDEQEKWFLRQLGVFVGGWTLEAAEAIAQTTETPVS